MTEISKQTLNEVRFQNIEETNLKTGITAILENNELSTKEKVDSLIEFIEVENAVDQLEKLEELTDELEEKVSDLRSEVIDFPEWIRTNDFQTSSKNKWIGLDLKEYTTKELYKQFKDTDHDS